MSGTVQPSDDHPSLDRAGKKHDHRAVLLAARVFALLLAVVLTALPPMAFADPPDPTWIGGYWDDDDFDNVVEALAATFALKAPERVAVELPTMVYVAQVPISHENDWRAPHPAAASSRAPPVASPTHN